MKFTLKLLVFFWTIPGYLPAQPTDKKSEPLLQVPKGYTNLKTAQQLDIDGKDFKLTWSDKNLYVYCRFEEEHIWANLKEHDLSPSIRILLLKCLQSLLFKSGLDNFHTKKN